MPPGWRRPLVATVMLVLLLALFFTAGFWQLDRAGEKRAVLQRYAAAVGDQPVTELVADSDAGAMRFRRVALRGRYVPERQVLLENMTDGGRNGYQVLTLFRSGNRHVLVNRGWLPADADRSKLPYISVDGEERTVTARINDYPAPGIRLDAPAGESSGWPRRMLFPTAIQLEQALGVELPAYQLQLAAGEPDGYLREWRAVASGPEKHLGYAFQWFSFAGLACIFYLILMFQWRRSMRARAPAENRRTTEDAS